eukprot:TRINITY_DN2096_c0_g1_i1.p1 TRINITY_DN2096_c0_g1~~TRINITY_DN2096_c0_g1_i1.p1  ORF type:complete len:219 (+),score=45.66 TRINITY_DN2096_c0_g1_i1:33-689(+)
MSTAQDDKEQHLYKVLVIGDYAVGKTSIIKRYCEGYFTPNYKLTIGVDFAVKEIQTTEDKKVTLQLWDVAGHERFGTMTRVYYKYAIAAIIVFDVSRPATFEAVAKWRQDVNDKVVLANNEPIPLILLANKCDIPGVTIDNEAIDEYARANGFLAWYKTSAQDNINIDNAMQFLVSKILDIAKENRPVQVPTPNAVVLNQNSTPVQKPVDEKTKNCCD